METGVYILCARMVEAKEIARDRGLERGWIFVRCSGDFFGSIRSVVYRTPCWTQGRNQEDVEEIVDQLGCWDAKVIDISCPRRYRKR